MRILSAALLVAFLLALLSGCGGGGDSRAPDTKPPVTTGAVDGYVYFNRARGQMQVAPTARSAGDGLSGVTVSVRGYAALTVVTDGAGHFRIEKVPTGAQQLFFESAQYTRVTVTVTVKTGENPIDSLTMAVAAKHKWTVMVYMAADNNLIQAAYANFNDMEKAPESPLDPLTNLPSVKTLVQFDRPTGDACLYDVHHDENPTTITSPVLRTLGNIDSGNPATLHDFITWCQAYAPAEHYLLILWDHGSGWDPDSDRVRPRAIGFDDTSGTVIRDIDLPAALQGRDPIDIVAMDACLMSMLEVAYELRHQVDYQVSSEELTPVEGYNYTDLVGKLTTGTGYQIAPRDYAIYLAQDAFNYWNEDSGPFSPLASSALDLSRVAAVAGAVDNFAARLLAVGAANKTGLNTARQNVTRFNAYSDGTLVDLSHFAALVSANINDAQLRTYAAKVQSTVAQAVIANEYTTSRAQAKGISIYMPGQRTYFSTGASTSYPLLDLSKSTHWDEWLSGQPE